MTDAPVGQQLQQARQAREISLEDAARATRLRVHYLQALEAGDYASLPSAVQGRGFVRVYAAYLGLDAEALLAMLESEASASAPPAAPVGDPPLPPEASSGEAPFVFVGKRLHRQRELLGLSLADVERHTHLRLVYLKALEAGDMASLPSPVQGRGMLKNYAAFLGMDPEPLLLRFAEGLQNQLSARQAEQIPAPRRRPAPAPVRPPSPLRRFFSLEMFVGGLLVLFLGGFVLWAAIRITAMREVAQVSPTAMSISQVLLSTAEATPTASPAPATPTPPEALAPALPTQAVTPLGLIPGEATNTVQVVLTIRQRAWLRVLVDGEIELEGRVLPGSAYQFAGASSVEVLTSNAAGISLFFNQQDLGVMGNFGEVVRRVFTLEGIQTPTPTITHTPTATPRPSRTPQATAAP
jgi:cytoskeletal protein RodZ